MGTGAGELTGGVWVLTGSLGVGIEVEELTKDELVLTGLFGLPLDMGGVLTLPPVPGF